MHIRKELRHKRWDEVSAEFLDFTQTPFLLDPEPFHPFLPAYLFRSLDDLDSNVAEYTIDDLCPFVPIRGEDQSRLRDYQAGRLLDMAGLMSSAQIQAVRAFLTFGRENAGEHECLDRLITPALEDYWR